MSKIIITRSSDFINFVRKISIYNNEEKIGEIGNGQTKEFTVDSGHLKISARIDWVESESIRVAIKDGEIRKFNLSSRNPNNPMAISLSPNNSLFLRLDD